MTRRVRTMTTGMRRPSGRAAWCWLLLAAALLTLALAACAPAANVGIATAGGSQQAAAADTKQGPVDREDAAVAYAQCMRENGVPDFPDPDPQGRMMITRRQSDSNDAAKFQAAAEACRDLRPAGAGGGPGPVDEETRFALARCMRENGVEDFPDPSPGEEPGVLRIGPGQGIDPNDPDFQAAMQTCRASVLGGAP